MISNPVNYNFHVGLIGPLGERQHFWRLYTTVDRYIHLISYSSMHPRQWIPIQESTMRRKLFQVIFLEELRAVYYTHVCATLTYEEVGATTQRTLSALYSSRLCVHIWLIRPIREPRATGTYKGTWFSRFIRWHHIGIKYSDLNCRCAF